MAWILGIGVALFLLLVFWKKLAAWLPASWTGTATTTIGTVAETVRDTGIDGAVEILLLALWADDDLVSIAKLAEVKASILAGRAAPVAPTATVESLAAEIAALKAAAKTTPTIPAASVAGA
jgi:hypothetical protein